LPKATLQLAEPGRQRGIGPLELADLGVQRGVGRPQLVDERGLHGHHRR
jgi:hypothetical protein